MARILLIGGSGRSGTTILCRAMGRHPAVTDVPEWRFTTDPDGVVDFYTQSVYGLRSPFHFDLRLRRLQSLLTSVTARGPIDAVLGSASVRSWAAERLHRNVSPAYARTNAVDYSPRFDALRIQLVETLTSFRYPGYWVGMSALERTELAFSDQNNEDIRLACQMFLESVADDVCTAQGATVHLEKNTWNILCWDRTLEVLPTAKLVHIVRDPRDVVASYSDQSWVPTDPVHAARILASIMNEWAEISTRVPRESYCEVRLEDLTREPEQEFRKLCEFWDLDWDDALLDTRLSNSSFGRWRSDLPPQHLDAVTGIVEPIMDRYGYA